MRVPCRCGRRGGAFFYIGGYVHLRSWARARERGVGLGAFVLRRLRRLAVPAVALLVAWIAVGVLVGAYFDFAGIRRLVTLIVSPLWFIAIYLMLVALLPAALWLHRRFGVLALVWLLGWYHPGGRPTSRSRGG